MREKLAAAALLACAWAAARSPAQQAGSPPRSEAQGSLGYTVELEGLQERAQRLELQAAGWRLLALERGVGLQADYLALGLASRWCALGPVAPRGLLRALADPLGYAPGSAVFAEPTGLRLEGGLQGASRRGLWLEPLPGRLGLFALRKPPPSPRSGGNGLFGGGSPGLVQAGGAAAFRWPGSAPVRGQARALVLLSLPPVEGPDPPVLDWLLERPPFPGGGLLHLGGSLRLESGSGRLACFLLAAAAGGQRVPAGLLGLCRLEAAGAAWSAQGLLGACSPDYRLPEGELYPGAWAAGLRLQARPVPALRLAGSWRRRIDRPSAASTAPEGFLPGTEEGELTAWLEAPLDAGSRVEARAEAAARVKYSADGEAERSTAADLELALRGPPGRLALGIHGDWREEGIELRGRMGAEHRGVRMQAGAAGRLKAGRAAGGLRWRPFGRLELSGEDSLFWISAGACDGWRGVSLGWSARQAVPKSPTVRTSRSRR